MQTDTTAELTAAMIPLGKIHPGANVRRTLTGIDTPAASMQRHGVLSAITVTRREDGAYDLVAGARRLAAAEKAKLSTIPAIVRDREDDAERLRQQLAENLDREGLADLERGAAIQELLDLGVTADVIAETVSTTPANVHAWADLLRLPKKVRTLIDKGRLTGADAYPLVALLEDNKRMKQALEMIDNGWEVDHAVASIQRQKDRDDARAAALAQMDADGVTVVDAPQWNSYSASSLTQHVGKAFRDVHLTVREHAKFACHAAYYSEHSGIVYVCTNRKAHPVPVDAEANAERAATRATNRALKEAHTLRAGALRDAVRAHAIVTDEAVAHVLRNSIKQAEHRDYVEAVTMLELDAAGQAYHAERDALVAHANTGRDALVDVALAIALVRGERAWTSERYDWRTGMVAEHASFIQATGIHTLSEVEEQLVKRLSPRDCETDEDIGTPAEAA